MVFGELWIGQIKFMVSDFKKFLGLNLCLARGLKLEIKI
jgi:hypothetical protein